MAISGIHAFLDILSSHGVHYIFGNPGSTELPLNDALVDDDRFQYILGLQEIPVMAMADGFSMASGSLGVVNLHVCPGLGNAMGMLYNAFREGTPLLVTAGQQDRRLAGDAPILGGQMVETVTAWTKSAVEVQHLADLPSAVRRAVQVALTPPTGPVFLSLPVDLQMELSSDLDLSPPVLPDCRIQPPRDAIQRATELLATARHPAILAGSRVTERGANQELQQVAELLGAVVITESGTTHGRLVFDSNHPLYGQGLSPWAPEVHARLEAFDTILVTGMDLLRLYIYHEPERAIPEHIQLIHLDEDPAEIGKNYPVKVGLWGDTKTGLQALCDSLEDQMTASQRESASQRAKLAAANHAAAKSEIHAKIESQRDQTPLTPLCFMEAVARVLPPEIAVVEEAVTTTNTTLERLGVLRDPQGYFGHRGWGLGWGLGCTLGAQLAWPDRPVLGILGEGAAMYGIQGLWSAVKYQIPASLIIANNAQYNILKTCAQTMGLAAAQQGKYEGFDLIDPEYDLVAMAAAFGMRAVRVDTADDVSAALKESLSLAEPMLIDVPIQRVTQPKLEYG
ncbi:MAG: thiamine pyrophosphate-binding protein [Planctomycetota bacterium]|nr:thiamine pyrophosphate-binding protein [Planctomycetota bacterium]